MVCEGNEKNIKIVKSTKKYMYVFKTDFLSQFDSKIIKLVLLNNYFGL